MSTADRIRARFEAYGKEAGPVVPWSRPQAQSPSARLVSARGGEGSEVPKPGAVVVP